MRIVAVSLSLLLLAFVTPLQAQDQLAATPPMGWNSWNHFAGHVTDADVRGAADQLVSTGMKDAGYIYVNVDDTWQGKRDAQGILHPNERFPDMKALGSYIHSKGLKFGIYSSPGNQTCGRYEGSLDHETQDAQMYASWGVDFLKYDLCSMQDTMRKLTAEHHGDIGPANTLMLSAFRKMGDALKATGRPMLYSLCQYGLEQPWKFGPGVGGQMWRTTDDINDTYGQMILIAYEQAGLSSFAGPGHWNDPDMLEVGNGGMSTDEYKTHMTLWAILAAPLLAGNDLSKMSPTDKAILMNKEVVAIDQDSLGKPGDRILQSGDFSVWTRKLTGGRTAVALVSAARSSREVSLNLADAGIGKSAHLRDVWANQDVVPQSGKISRILPRHSVLLLIASE